MLVVADTSALNYLLLIYQETLLSVLYERVVIPPAVPVLILPPGEGAQH
jgi:predicted nucleic acid-binding protein